MTPLEATPDGVRLAVRVQPRASRTEVAGLYGSELRIRLAAPPVDGAGNAALIRFLAETFDLPRSAIQVTAGATARRKTIRVAGIRLQDAARRLGLAEPPRAGRP